MTAPEPEYEYAVEERLIARFQQHTPNRGDGCWEWTGARQRVRGVNRYGLIVGKPKVFAHRWSYQFFKGPIPVGFVVRHTCDNPPCVNPAHLLVGTRQDNVQDAVDRGRNVKGERCPSSKYTAEQVAQMRQMRTAGAKPLDIAAQFGVAGKYIYELLRPDKHWRSEGVPRGTGRRSTRYTAEHVAEMQRLRDAGMSPVEISERFGVKGKHIYYLLRRSA